MELVAALVGGMGVLAMVVGVWRMAGERGHAPAMAVAAAAGASAGEAERPPGPRPGARRPLPRPLRYVERRAKTAGVEWDLLTVVALIAGSGLGAAGVIALATGVLWMALLAAGAGFWAPIWQLGRLTARRAQQVLRQLDQVCTELVQALSGGQDLYAAILLQAQRAPDPVGYELRRVMERVRQGEPLAEAIAELPERIALDEARLFSVGVRLALDSGARIVPVLESIQRSLRGRRELQGLMRELSVRNERQSLILMVVPMVMLLAMRVEAPQYVAPLLGTAGGQLLMAADVAWMLLGMRLVRGLFAASPRT